MWVPADVVIERNRSRLIERTLPVRGNIRLKEGDQVRLESVVGDYQHAASFRNYNLSRLLQIPPEKVEECLLVPVGAEVYMGTPVAKNSKLWGLKTIEFASPVEGVIFSLSDNSGVLTIKETPEKRNLVAGVNGTVQKVMPGKGVKIGTTVSSARTKLAVGNDRAGMIKIVSNRDITLTDRVITSECSGKIVVGGALLTREVVHKCLALKVRAVVCGGIHWSTFRGIISSARGRMEDIGTTICVTEGFGFQPMGDEIFRFLSGYENHFGMILSRLKEVIIPLSDQEASGDPVGDKDREREAEVKAGLGYGVRVVELPRLDLFGKIGESGPVTSKSGSKFTTPCLDIDVDGETMSKPIRNLEVNCPNSRKAG